MVDLGSFGNSMKGRANEIVRWWWWYIGEISWQLTAGVVAYLFVCGFLYAILKRVNHEAWELPGPPSRILLVTAHPDDEIMFFGPMLYSLVNRAVSDVHLLCFTIGICLAYLFIPRFFPCLGATAPAAANATAAFAAADIPTIPIFQRSAYRSVYESVFAGGDKRRKEELWSCAKILGIPEAGVTILMNSELPDDPTVQWSSDVVAERILQHVEIYKINALVTFDKHGVSGHKNHTSLFYGIALLCVEGRVPSYCKLYALESVNIVRKYSWLLDLPISLLSSSYWYLVTYEQRKLIKRAMAAHRSQYVWFRKLYMAFSRYTFINTLQEVNALDLELDLQFEDD